MKITKKELEIIANSLTEKHGIEVYGLASALHMACGLFINLQINSGVNLSHHIMFLEKACGVYGEILGFSPNAIATARLDIEQSAKTINIINKILD